MKKILKNSINIFLGLLIITSLTPIVSFAQDVLPVGDQAVTDSESMWSKIRKEEGKYKFIAPLGPIASVLGDTADLTTGEALIEYLKTWFKFLVGIGGIIGVVRLVMVGFSIITSAGSVNAVSKIKEELISIITALVLVAGSWAFLNTINPTLVNSSLIINKTTSSSTLVQIETLDSESTEDKEVTAGVMSKGTYYVKKTEAGKQAVGPYPSHEDCENDVKEIKKSNKVKEGEELSDKCYDHSAYKSTAEEQSGRELLAEGNVYVNKSACSKPEQRNCTRIEDLGMSSLSSIVSLTQDCCSGQPRCTQGQITNGSVCFVVVTGGTEAGHSSHGTNKPDVFDLKYTETLHNFLLENATIIDNSFYSNVRYFYKKFWYTDEYFSAPGSKSARHFHTCLEGGSSGGQGCSKVEASMLENEKVCKPNVSNDSQKRCNTNKIQDAR